MSNVAGKLKDTAYSFRANAGDEPTDFQRRAYVRTP